MFKPLNSFLTAYFACVAINETNWMKPAYLYFIVLTEYVKRVSSSKLLSSSPGRNKINFQESIYRFKK